MFPRALKVLPPSLEIDPLKPPLTITSGFFGSTTILEK